MTTVPKTLLTISIVGFAISLTGPGGEFFHGIIKPISAICFVLFYITHLLAKEVAAYDQEQSAKLGSMAPARSRASASSGESPASGGHSPSFARATAR